MLGLFCDQHTLLKRFMLDVIRFIHYGVIADKPRVGHLPEFFGASCRKTVRWIDNDCAV